MTRILRRICCTVIGAVGFSSLLTTPVQAAPPSFGDQVAASLTSREPGTSAALKEFAASLTPGNAIGTRVLSDSDSLYLVDQIRPVSAVAVDAMRAHDMAYVGDLSTTKDAPVAFVTAVVADLNANRRSAEMLLQDLRLVSTFKPVGNSLDLGTKFLEQANDAWAKGNPKLAVEKFAEVQRRVFDGFGSAGLSFVPGVDTDKDGIEDYRELIYKSSPFTGDTDGDGLTDPFEIEFGGTYHQPNNRDSDGDGVLDPAEDEDADGLTALVEQAKQSDPLLPDSDADTLANTLEIGTTLTKPLDPYTDRDGVSDGVEFRDRTNPNNPGSMQLALVKISATLLALVFAWAAIAKVANRPLARAAAADLGVPERWAGVTMHFVPVAELAVALLLLVGTFRHNARGLRTAGSVGALVLLLGFTALIGQTLRNGKRPACFCFGSRSHSPLSRDHVVRNVALGALAIIVLVG